MKEQNRTLNRTFGAKCGTATEYCEGMNTKELLVYNVSPNFTRTIRGKGGGRGLDGEGNRHGRNYICIQRFGSETSK